MLKFFVFAVSFFINIHAAQYLTPSENELTDIVEWKVNFSDSTHFADIEYSDDNWTKRSIVDLWKDDGGENSGFGVRWYRSKIFISEFVSFTEKLSVFIPAAISAYEVYWDGIKIGESGEVAANKDNEITGKSAGIFIIPPPQSSVGEHILAIRISNFSEISGIVEESPKIGFLTEIITGGLRQIAISFLLVGIIFITAIFNTIFIAKSLNIKTHITYALLSICCCGHILIPVFPHWFSVNLENYYSLALIGDVFWIGILSLLPIYFFQLFDYKKLRIKAIVISGLSIIIVIFPRLAIYGAVPISSLLFWETTNSFFAFASIILSVIIVFHASLKKKKGAKTILVGLLIFAVGVLTSYLLRQINGWSIGFAYLSCFVTIVMGRYFWEEMRKKNTAEIKNARLELELLKSRIQPHFLLNSLNSIVAWIEEDPKVASKLVNELSKELRLLMAFAEKRTISLMEEISLCKAHIQVMNLRKEKEISLKIFGHTEGITIPPLIIHTALENGITHGFIKKDKGIFVLKTEKSAKRIKISLENDGDNKISQNKKENGTGNKYIIQRLSEIYGKKFKFESKPKEDGSGWQIIFEIFRSEK